MINKLFKSVATGVLMTMALTTVTPARASEPAGAELAAVIAGLATVATTVTSARNHYDTTKAQSLIDEAYAGEGHRLEVLSVASKLPIETIADVIVALDKDGKLDANQPEQMAQTIAAAIQ